MTAEVRPILATQTTQAAVLAKLSADPATQTTLAAILAKLSADPATATGVASIVAALASIVGTVTLVDGANTAAVDSTGHVSVVVDALPLPSGAATSALQPGFGTAGSPSANVVSTQGVTNGTPEAVGVKVVPFAPSPTGLVDTAAYAPNDCLTAKFTLTGAARVSGGSGRIVKVNLFDGAAQAGTTFEVFFFKADFTAAAANAAFAISDADMANCVGSILISSSSLIAATGILYQNFSTVFPFKCAADANLYAQIVLRSGTPTYGANDIVPSFLIEQD